MMTFRIIKDEHIDELVARDNSVFRHDLSVQGDLSVRGELVVDGHKINASGAGVDVIQSKFDCTEENLDFPIFNLL